MENESPIKAMFVDRSFLLKRNSLTLYHTIPTFNNPVEEAF